MLLSYVHVSCDVQLYLPIERNGQAKAAATTGAKPHQHAMFVNTHCLLPGRYSRKTVVSRMRLPPLPKAARDVKAPKAYQFGEAPAQMAKTEQLKRETLNANRRPMMSAALKSISAIHVEL